MNRIPFSPPKTIAELAALLDASPLNVEFDRELLGFGTLETATDTDVSFFSDPRYADRAIESQALLITTESLARLLPARPLLLTTRPERAVYRLLHAHRANADAQSDQREAAYLDPTATIGDGVRLGPGCSVARGVQIGAQTTVAAGAVIEADAVLGSECWIGANAVIGARCRLGNRVVVQAGSVIGSDGFGYLTDGGVHCRIPHLGIVVLEDDVEVGANSCIDRATLGETRIGRGTKIDNLVQIAHNVQIGEHSLLAAQTGVSGSTRLGRYNVAGGQTGYAGHLQLDDGVIVGARAGVSKNLKRGTYAGFPIAPLARFRVQTALISMLPKLHERLRRLERWLHEKENT